MRHHVVEAIVLLQGMLPFCRKKIDWHEVCISILRV